MVYSCPDTVCGGDLAVNALPEDITDEEGTTVVAGRKETQSCTACNKTYYTDDLESGKSYV